MDKQELSGQERKISGRKVKNLRKEGVLPANIFGKGIKSESVQVGLKDFEKVFSKVGETGLVSLKIGNTEHPVLVHNVQVDPVSDIPVHIDFLQVNLKEKVEAEVPVELAGESPAEKQGIGTVVQYLNEVRVEALPTDLPEKFEVNTEDLSEVDQAVYVKDLKFDKAKIEIKDDPEGIVAKVEPPQKEEVAPPPAEEGAEGTGEAAAESGETAETASGEQTESPKEEEQK